MRRFVQALVALLTVATLAGAALAAVIPDGSQLPPGDTDAPKGANYRPKPRSPGQRPGIEVEADRNPGAPGLTRATPGAPGQHSPGAGSGSPGAKPGTGITPVVAATPGKAGDLEALSLPDGQPFPWSLVVLAVVLFAFAMGGGTYFYRSRDD